MMSEWLKIMLEEVARKRAQAEQERSEQQRRVSEVPESLQDPTRAKARAKG